MGILNKLTSQTPKGQSDNYRVAARCLEEPERINEIVAGLYNRDNAIVIDCAEVLTEVARVQPGQVAPYAAALPALLSNKNNRARWEGMHSLALVADRAPEVIAGLLEALDAIISNDTSVIVRDYAIDAVGGYAKTGSEAAQAALPILKRSLWVWEGRHAQHALAGLCNVVGVLPEFKASLRGVALEHTEHKSGVVRNAAKQLLRQIDG